MKGTNNFFFIRNERLRVPQCTPGGCPAVHCEIRLSKPRRVEEKSVPGTCHSEKESVKFLKFSKNLKKKKNYWEGKRGVTLLLDDIFNFRLLSRLSL